MAQAESRFNRQEKSEFPGLNVPDRPASDVEPNSLANVLHQLFLIRGYGKRRTNRQLHEIWNDAAGPHVGSLTKALALKSGVLHVAVFNPVMLQELNSFHKLEFKERLRRVAPDEKIKDIKFTFQSPTKKSPPTSDG